MKRLMHKKNRLATAISCIYVSLALSPVYASDVEIYTQAVANASVAPVVMMMFDTSGSMQWCMTDNNGCSYPNRRQDVLKDSVGKVLNGGGGVTPTPGYVKMGLARYQSNGSGGWVAYPARPLDAFVTINPDGYINAAVNASGGDTSGTSVSSASLDFTSSNDVGLYFPDVKIPLGATITGATITLTAKATSPLVTAWQPAIDNTGNAAPFNTTAINHASRNFVNFSAVEILPWVAENKYDIDVKSLVQSVAKDNPAWCGGNAMAFRLRDINGLTRSAYAFEGDSSKAPVLTVSYSIDPNKTDSCITTDMTSTFALGNTASGVNTAQAKKDDLEWKVGGSVIDNDNTTLSINSYSSGSANQAALRLTTMTPIPSGSQISSATLTFTPKDNYTAKQTVVKVAKSINLPTITAPIAAGDFSPTVTYIAANTALAKDILYDVDVRNLVNAVIPTSGSTEVSTIVMGLANNTTTTGDAKIYAADSGSMSRVAKMTVKWKGVVRDLSRLTTVRQELTAILNGLTFSGNTPLGAAYTESSRYLYGLQPFYTTPKSSIAGASYPNNPDARTVNSTTVSASQRYLSPIEQASQCSGNYVFLLTDGAPTSDGELNTNTKGITGHNCAVSAADESILQNGATVNGVLDTFDNTERTNWRCMMDLANVGNKTALHTGVISGTTAPIKTSTVILGPEGGGSEWGMRRVAELGGGDYTKANNAQALVDALTRTINSALDQSGVMASPGVAINQFNRLNTLDQIYYVLFDPSNANKRWDGNLKRYKLNVNGESILDANGVNAIEADGSFKKDSKSYWSTAVDGGSTSEGGAASKLPAPEDRNIYTYVDSSKTALDRVSLLNRAFVLNSKNKFPTMTNAQYNNLINWFKGYDIADVYGSEVTGSALANTPLRKKLGGGLHSRAVLVNYGFTGSTAADAQNVTKQKNIIFFSTLGATLHGVDPLNGEEKFAFIPGEKLPAIKTLYDNVGAVEPEYGMDLTWTVLRDDKNKDGQVTASAGDKLYMYGGMRMGGSNYYGLNLTDLSKPKMLFSIIGGSAGFEKLGQTWSQPVVTRMKIGGTEKQVLVFGGGYDMCYEDAVCSSTQLGNQLYIVDAEKGTKIWSASDTGATVNVPTMTYSIPSQPKVIDFNNDGLADVIYIGDLGGQLFRVDINNANTSAANLAKRVKLVAQLGESGAALPTSADERRIYEPPTVAIFKDSYLKRDFAAVAVGTGNRSRPLNGLVQDQFVTIFDYDITRKDLLNPLGGESTLQATVKTANLKLLDLAISSSSGIPTYTVDASGKPTKPNTYGWFVNLPDNGEKSLSSGLIYSARLMFNTYSPEVQSSGCKVVAGVSVPYEMCMPYGTQCDDSTPRRQTATIIGMGSEPQLVMQDSGTTTALGEPIYEEGLLNKTSVKKGESKVKQWMPAHRWREKTRYPIK